MTPKADIRMHKGAPTLFINGAPNAGMTYMTYHPEKKHYAAFGDKGVDLASLSVTADYALHFDQPTAWLGPGQYDFRDMDAKMEMILEANPEGYVFPRVYMCSPPWWDEQNPDELVKWDDGTMARPIGRKTTFPSWASEVYRQAASDTLRHFIAHVRKQRYADRVVGYHFCSGMWEEWFYWSSTGGSDGQSDLLDYSKPMVQAFRRWLGRKYGSDAALQKAWGMADAGLAKAEIPSKSERHASDHFVWRDPVLRANVIDFYRFYCETVTDIIKGLARTVKEATNGEQLVGVFYGYMFFSYADNWMQDNGHLALHKLLECEDVDFLAAPSAYAFRPFDMGYSMGQAATDAMRLHGKYYMNENDYPTHLVANQEEYRRVSTFADFEAVQLRELGSMLTHGWGGWWFDMSGGWYDDAKSMDTIGSLNRIGEKSIHCDRSARAEIAVVVDEDSIFYTGPQKTLMLPLMYEQILPLGRMGAPFEWVFLNDLDLARPYKFYIFMNAFHVDARQRSAIDRLKGRGAEALLWLYGAGFAGEKALDVEGCTDLTGIKIAAIAKAEPLWVEMTKAGADHLQSSDAHAVYGSKNAIGPILYPEDPDATVLGMLKGQGVPGLVLKQRDGVDVYYSAAPTVPASALRGMAARAGVHVYSDHDDALHANASFLSIYAATAGVRKIRLPERSDVYDVYNSRTIAQNATSFTVALPAKHSVLYFLGSESEWAKAE